MSEIEDQYEIPKCVDIVKAAWRKYYKEVYADSSDAQRQWRAVAELLGYDIEEVEDETSSSNR